MKYLIEKYDGVLLGPFDTAEDAAEYAVQHLMAPWTMRKLHLVQHKSDKR